MDDAARVHNVRNTSPEQRLAAGVIDRAMRDSLDRSPRGAPKAQDAFDWICTDQSLGWFALVTPAGQIPEELQHRAAGHVLAQQDQRIARAIDAQSEPRLQVPTPAPATAAEWAKAKVAAKRAAKAQAKANA